MPASRAIALIEVRSRPDSAKHLEAAAMMRARLQQRNLDAPGLPFGERFGVSHGLLLCEARSANDASLQFALPGAAGNRSRSTNRADLHNHRFRRHENPRNDAARPARTARGVD